MSSKTAKTELIRKKKETSQGKSRKKENAKKGTINFYKAFDVPAEDDSKNSKTKKQAS